MGEGEKLIVFPYIYIIQSIFIYMKLFLCSAHLNFGNSTHKFLHINQFQIFPAGGSPWTPIYALEMHQKIENTFTL